MTVMSKSMPPFDPPFKEIALIYWKDAYVTTDENPKLDHKDDLTISMGVIVEENKKEVTISSFYDGIGQQMASPFQVIPAAMIKHITRLKCSKKGRTI